MRDYVMDTSHQEKDGVNPSLLPTYVIAKYTPKCSLRWRMFTTFFILPLAYSRDAWMDFNA